MSNIDDNREWELETPHLAGLSRETPFIISEDYFAELARHIKTSIFLSSLNQQSGFIVPAKYFEGLAQKINTKLASTRVLGQPVKNTGFDVPLGYFESLPQRIEFKIKAQQKPKKIWQHRWIKYASAACLALICGSGFYFNYHQPSQLLANTDLQNENILYDIDESMIMEQIIEKQQHPASQEISSSDVENYILNNFSSADIRNHL